MNRIHALIFLLSGFLLFLSPQTGLGQTRCGTVELDKIRHSNVAERDRQFEEWMRSKINQPRMRTFGLESTQAGTYIIPVVVHIIHSGEPIGTGTNLSVAQINSQIQVLNEDFNRMNADASSTPAVFLPAAGSLNIQFVLARQDPDGLPTNGVTRTLGTKTSWTMADEKQFKALSYWAAEDYLNIWVLNLAGNLLGFAQLPESAQLLGLEDASPDRLTDGVFIHYRCFGSGTSFNLLTQYNKGRTTTHEVGHFFGLRHMWGDANCATDYVDDTPYQTTNTDNCPTHPQASCDVPSKPSKMFQDFMDYTNDVCMNLFTNGQGARMTVVIENSPRRLSLLSSKGAVPSGDQVNDAELTSIVSPGLVHCVTSPMIQFNLKNLSTSAITSFQLKKVFNGGVAVTQTFSNVLIDIGDEKQFELTASPLMSGRNLITLTVINPNGFPDDIPANSTLTFVTYVDKTNETAPLRLSFDNSTEVPWLIANPGTNLDWEFVSTSKNKSLVYKAFNNSMIGQEAWLVSPVLDFSKNSKNSFFFDVSYAQRVPQDDRLKLVVSDDCGLTYKTVLFDEAGSVFGVTTSGSEWTPTSNSDWSRQYINIDELSGKKNIRMAFIASNDHGNNLYMDNLEIFADDSPSPIILNEPYKLYYSTRNTLSDIALSFNLPQKKDVRLQIFSLLGQVVADNILPETINQTYYFDLGLQASGLYLFRLQIDNQVSTTKVFIGH